MRFFSPFRLATCLLALFFLGHTGGGMLAQKSLGPASDAVFAQMKTTHFIFNGADCTWYGFWFGFGLTVSIFLAFSAVALWQLDKVEAQAWPQVAGLAWALAVAHALNAALAFKYFFLGPTLFGVLITGLIAYGTLRRGKRRPGAEIPRVPEPALHRDATAR
jgi:hypothetical protein